ncbi:MAG: hypothetical protein OEZ43_12745 [Gammaproteobacteria bacterium]|nr:hypothetical protein [Gammaproteobacteria bacterium]
MDSEKISGSDHVIRYKFAKENGQSVSYIIEIDGNSLLRKGVSINPEHESWTSLEHNQCRHCPLTTETHRHCPAALTLSAIIDDWADSRPTDEVYLECRTAQRRITAYASVQNGLGALLGLLLATSECPHFNFFKPMARFHLPLATPAESYFRVLGTYFVQEFFANKGDMSHVLDDITKLYNDLERVNQSLAKRVISYKNQSATLSALVVLDLLAKLFSVSPEESLEEIQRLFPAKGRDSH